MLGDIVEADMDGLLFTATCVGCFFFAQSVIYATLLPM